MKKLIFSILLLLIIAPAFAEEEIPVNIKAENLKYMEGTNIVVAQGSVEVKLADVTIHADSLTMDTKTNIVTAEGNVKLSGLGYDADCTGLVYSVSNETSSYLGFKTVVAPSTVKGSVYLQADQIDDSHKKMVGHEGKVTTCSYAHPHYFTAANRVEYYPNDKIVGYFATFYIMDAPILWIPYIEYDLKQKQRRNWSFGTNNVEGDFVKTSWDYPYGQIYLDEMSKKGFGHGLTYDYAKDNQNGHVYLYHLEEADTHLSDIVAKINHNIGITDKTTLGLGYANSIIYQVPAGRLDQTNYSLNFNSTGDKKLSTSINAYDNRIAKQERLDLSSSYSIGTNLTSYNLNLDQGKGDNRYIRVSERLSHSQQLFSDKTKLNFNAAYYDNIAAAGKPGSQLLEPNIEITQQEASYNIRYYENLHLDLDNNLDGTDATDQYLETKPEITLNLNPWKTQFVDLSSSFAYGWYHEVRYSPGIHSNRDFATGRQKATFGANKTYPLGLGTSLSMGLGLDQFMYDPGDEMNAFREDFGLNSQGYNFFRNTVKYTRGISDGNSPFYFDKISTRYHNISDTMTFYYQSYFNWINNCGYNYETKKYLNYDSSMSIKPSNSVDMNFRSGFDIENQKYLDLSSTLRLVPWEKFTTTMNLVNDMNLGGLKQGNYLVDLETGDEADWGNHWHFKYGYVYDGASKNFVPRDIMIIKDLHCWEVKYTYSDYLKQTTMTFTLKAFPGDPIGYQDNRGFYFDSFDQAVKAETNQSSPTRY